MLVNAFIPIIKADNDTFLKISFVLENIIESECPVSVISQKPDLFSELFRRNGIDAQFIFGIDFMVDENRNGLKDVDDVRVFDCAVFLLELPTSP